MSPPEADKANYFTASKYFIKLNFLKNRAKSKVTKASLRKTLRISRTCWPNTNATFCVLCFGAINAIYVEKLLNLTDCSSGTDPIWGTVPEKVFLRKISYLGICSSGNIQWSVPLVNNPRELFRELLKKCSRNFFSETVFEEMFQEDMKYQMRRNSIWKSE